LISLTVALIPGVQGRFTHPAELSDTLAELKRYGKATPRSVVVRERRQRTDDPELILSGAAAGTAVPATHGDGNDSQTRD